MPIRSLGTILNSRPVYILTGLSGSGKSTAARALEDRGYFVVDNLPLVLLPQCLELTASDAKNERRLAVVIDVRNREYLAQYGTIISQLKARGYPLETCFFEAADEVLIRRYSETRRRHPLGESTDLPQAIERERKLLLSVRETATRIIDSSGLNPHQLREILLETFSDEQLSPLMLQLESFGFRYGLPPAADLVFDVRFLPNPYYLAELRPLSGLDLALRHYVLDQPDCRNFYAHLLQMLDFLLPLYIAEGKSYLTLALGCTGGRHRSVALVEELSRQLASDKIRVRVVHRDINKSDH
ncbi:MAG: RNase adapter RapZ [Deltaproteobacteria bacterium]|nr:RNase adapter RapZ [Deltaproteobacteria bacterium]